MAGLPRRDLADIEQKVEGRQKKKTRTTHQREKSLEQCSLRVVSLGASGGPGLLGDRSARSRGGPDLTRLATSREGSCHANGLATRGGGATISNTNKTLRSLPNIRPDTDEPDTGPNPQDILPGPRMGLQPPPPAQTSPNAHHRQNDPQTPHRLEVIPYRPSQGPRHPGVIFPCKL